MRYEYKISICMMVKDEEKNLTRCLEKLKPLIETGIAELIIVDTGSKDNTLMIAESYTNKVYFHSWNNNFSEMRNKSISYAKGEWIFIIDADERLDDTKELINLFKSHELDKFNTVQINVKNLHNSSDENKYNLNISPRLFRNDGSFKYVGAVHNQPIFNEPILSSSISLTHFGYVSNDKNLMDNKFNRTTELLKKELEKDSNNLYYVYQLGVSYDMHGDYECALNEFKKAYSLLSNKGSKEKKLYIYILAAYANSAYRNSKFDEAINASRETINLNNEYADMYYIAGFCEKHTGNIEKSFDYLCKYVDLVNRYNKLQISKNNSIAMYYINKNSVSNAYFEICKYYLSNENYMDAFKIYNNINSTNEKIYTGINLLLPLEKYLDLRKIYESFSSAKDRNNFLCTLEERIKKIEDSKKINLYKEFSLNEDLYGSFNKLRISSAIDDKISLTKHLIKEINFDNEPVFYSEIFENVKENTKFIIDVFKGIEVLQLKDIIKYLISEKQFKEIFENYILENNEAIKSIEESRVFIRIANVLLLLYIKDNDKVNEKYLKIFKAYINMGLFFTQELYRVENAQLIYKNISNQEDRFFMIMHIINKLLKEYNKKSAVKCMIEAVNTYEAFAKYIDIYKDEVFKLEENMEFEDYKLKVKENINNLVNSGLLDEAKGLISEFENIVKNDVDIYSMKAVIAIIEGKINDGEKILRSGLKIDGSNADLLLNLSYIQFQSNNTRKSVETYSKAKLFNPNNKVKVGEIITNLQQVDNENLRVLNGTMEIANQMSTITKGLRKLGVDAKSLNYYPNYLGYNTDYTLNLNSFKNMNEANVEIKNLASKMIAENDMFHFHFGTSLTLDYCDLPILKELGKKVIMQYWGSDVRMYSKAVKFNPYIKVKDMNESGIRHKLELISKYVSHCFVDYELAEYVKGYHDNIHYTRVAIDLNKYKFVNETNNKKMLIVHAPTSPEIKGTSYILKAVEDLKEKYDFDFQLVQGMPHEQASKIYKRADLIIDQILIGGYGVFAVESMAMGKPVICWIDDFMKEKYPKELPIISANPDNIKEIIKYAIENKDMLKEIGTKSRIYVEKYHDMNIICENILQAYKNL